MLSTKSKIDQSCTVEVIPSTQDGEFEIRCAPIDITEVKSSEFLIKFVNSDFCFLNKPPDVRMNGDFLISVEKILLSWDKSLVSNDLKWVHRLDFATSGIKYYKLYLFLHQNLIWNLKYMLLLKEYYV